MYYQLETSGQTEPSPAEAFTDQYRDIVGDEWDFLYRQEHSSQGRWISPDPAGMAADPANPQMWNRYAYVGGSPLSSIDPVGLACYGLELKMFGRCPIPVPAFGASWSVFQLIESECESVDCKPYNIGNGLTAALLLDDGGDPNIGPAANNGNNPIVPANPCNRAGTAPDPSVYQAKGQAAQNNAILDLYYLPQFMRGGALDAQVRYGGLACLRELRVRRLHERGRIHARPGSFRCGLHRTAFLQIPRQHRDGPQTSVHAHGERHEYHVWV